MYVRLMSGRAPGGYIHHVFNRAIAGAQIFDTPEDYLAFERILAEACRRMPMRILAYCLMPNHWHLVLWPYEDGDVSKFMHWVTTTHVRRWRECRESVGRGHLYQGTYKSFPVEEGLHLVMLCRYVERNARAANLVRRAEEWRFGSLWRRLHCDRTSGPPLSEWPVDRPDDWVQFVNDPQTTKELEAISRSETRSCPLGSKVWQQRVATELGLGSTTRPRGRPRKGA